MRDRAGLEPAMNRAFDIGEWPAHVVRYDDDTGEEVVSLYYVFLAASGGSFTFMAMGYEHLRETLRESVLSIRPASRTAWAVRPGRSSQRRSTGWRKITSAAANRASMCARSATSSTDD